MRKPIIAGNWKMHGSQQTVRALLQAIQSGLTGSTGAEVVVFPPYVFLDQVQRELSASTTIAWGGQNMSAHTQGAFTGEISGGMLREFACRYVLLGHSERRTLFGESNDLVAAKFQVAITAGLSPIVCLGESLAEREKGLTDAVVRGQLEAILAVDKGLALLAETVIAYEPVWAIGTGVTASPELAQEVHAKIRGWVAEYDKTIAQGLRILYGGSVKSDNAAALFAMPDIDGGLIGGASLNATEFLDIIKSCSN